MLGCWPEAASAPTGFAAGSYPRFPRVRWSHLSYRCSVFPASPPAVAIRRFAPRFWEPCGFLLLAGGRVRSHRLRSWELPAFSASSVESPELPVLCFPGFASSCRNPSLRSSILGTLRVPAVGRRPGPPRRRSHLGYPCCFPAMLRAHGQATRLARKPPGLTNAADLGAKRLGEKDTTPPHTDGAQRSAQA